MSGPRALWIPFDVEDLDKATRFYTGHLGLSQVDGWDRDGESGVVLRAAEGAYIELVSPGFSSQVPLAFELPSTADVDSCYAQWRPGAEEEIALPHRYPRGHYGFEARGPAGAQIMVWSER